MQLVGARLRKRSRVAAMRARGRARACGCRAHAGEVACVEAEHGGARRAATWQKAAADTTSNMNLRGMRPAASTVALLAMAAGLGMGAPVPRYAVIFDAGSTGTRVHIYAWRLNDNASPTVTTAPGWSEKVSPGISSFFPDNAAGAGESILPLLATAERVVPALERARCIVMLRATAGMRLIPRRAQAAIYDSLHNTVITRSGFRPARADFATLSGSEEGIFGWLATNHLLVSAGLLSASRLGAVGAIDLGGGSTQAGRNPRVCS